MHVAEQLFLESFGVSVNGEAATSDDVFPDWRRHDRFGIVVKETLGALGAALLIELAIAKFFVIDPSRRSSHRSYPDIFLFHVGGPHGDFSYFDFWPPRKEVRVANGDTLGLFEALNDRAITRLAVPSTPLRSTVALDGGPNTWSEVGAAKDRLRSCFRYDPSGSIESGDVVISSADPRTHKNVDSTLNLAGGTVKLPEPRRPGLSVDEDDQRWFDFTVARQRDEPTIDRGIVAEHRRTHGVRSGSLRQTLLRVPVDVALSALGAPT